MNKEEFERYVQENGLWTNDSDFRAVDPQELAKVKRCLEWTIHEMRAVTNPESALMQRRTESCLEMLSVALQTVHKLLLDPKHSELVEHYREHLTDIHSKDPEKLLQRVKSYDN